MIEAVCEKDDLYYSDMAYVLKRRFGIIKFCNRNVETERRIASRLCSVPVTVNGITSNICSPFMEEIFLVVDEISQRVGIENKHFSELSKHPSAINEVLGELEARGSKTFQRSK